MTVYLFFAIPSLHGIILAQPDEFRACQPPESRLFNFNFSSQLPKQIIK